MASMSMVTVLCALVCIVLMFTTAQGRSMNSATMNEIPSRFMTVKKRMPFDPSCKGVFDPVLYKKLDTVCQDCFYLYYDEELTTRCRTNCFMNDTFRYCTVDMLYPEDEYMNIARKLHSKAG